MKAKHHMLTIALAITTLLVVSSASFANGPQIYFQTGNLNGIANTHLTASLGGSSLKHWGGHHGHGMPHYPPGYYSPAPHWGGGMYCPPPRSYSCNRYLVLKYTCRYGWTVHGEYSCRSAASRAAQRLRYHGYRTYIRRIYR